MQDAPVVRRETHISAPRAAVFALLTDPEKILRWMGTEAQLEAQPGGLYLVNVTGARFARGSFREVVPVHRLAYSFGWDGSEEVPPGSSLVEIDLMEQRRAVWVLALSRPSVLPSVTGTTSAPRMRVLSRLNGWPMRSPVNASPIPSRVSAHNSGSMRFATPSS
jgi:uncharacterized protein YndB with AHSA1/START domain